MELEAEKPVRAVIAPRLDRRLGKVVFLIGNRTSVIAIMAQVSNKPTICA